MKLFDMLFPKWLTTRLKQQRLPLFHSSVFALFYLFRSLFVALQDPFRKRKRDGIKNVNFDSAINLFSSIFVQMISRYAARAGASHKSVQPRGRENLFLNIRVIQNKWKTLFSLCNSKIFRGNMYMRLCVRKHFIRCQSAVCTNDSFVN